jgi:DNA-binding SARP family transcriptional activator
MDDRGGEAAIRVRLRGGTVELWNADGVRRLGGRRALALAAVALLGPVRRERLAGLMWPDADGPAARAALRQTLLRLGRTGVALRGDPLALEVGATLLDDEPDGAGDPFEVPDEGASGELAELLAAAQERRRAAVARAADEAYRVARAAGRPHDAVAAARRWLTADPRSLEAHMALLRAFDAAGDAGALLDAYGRLRTLLARSVDAEPPDEAVALARRAAVASASRDLRRAATSAAPGPDVVRRAETEGRLAEGAALLREAVPSARSRAERGRLRIGLAWLEHQAGRSDVAEVEARAGLADLGDAVGCGEGWFVLGSIARHRGRPDEAREAWRRALAHAGARSDARGISRARLHLNLAQVEDALGDVEAARPHYLAAQRAAREDGDARSEAVVLNNLAHAALAAGGPGEAGVLIGRAVTLATGLEDRQLDGYLADGVARVRLAEGEAEAARGWAARAVEIGREVGDAALRVEGLATLAEALRATGDEDGSRTMAAAAERLARRAGYEPGLARLRGVAARAVTPASRRIPQAGPGREDDHGEGPEVP